MKGILSLGVLLSLIASAYCIPPHWYELTSDYSFEQYCIDFGKKYDDAAIYELRRSIFKMRLADVLVHNSKQLSWQKGVNHLSDWTPEELNSMRGYNKALGFSQHNSNRKRTPPPPPPSRASQKITALPDMVDWRQKGIVTPVKDQGQCGSCWTFGTTETIESYWALKTGRLQELSEQFILDCVMNPDQCGGTGGCGGGTAELIFEALLQNKWGVPSEWTMPYMSYFGNSSQCPSNSETLTFAASISNYAVLPSNEYDPIMETLAFKGPLIINIDASAWHSYESGVFGGCNATHLDLDHVVQLVGYGTDPNFGDYWLVRNSWTPNWGEGGYIRLARSSTVTCAIDNTPGDGTGCKGAGPQTVCGSCGILFDVSYPEI